MNGQRNDGAIAGANALMILSGLAGIIAGAWLAVEGEWAGALGSLLVIVLAVGGLVAVHERTGRPTGDSSFTAPWSGAPDWLKLLEPTQVDRIRSYYAAQRVAEQYPGMRVETEPPFPREILDSVRDEFEELYGRHETGQPGVPRQGVPRQERS